MNIKAVIFDLETTLVQPTGFDFDRLKASIGCPAETSIVEFLQGISDVGERSGVLSSLNRQEVEAAANSMIPPGTGRLLRYLELKKISLAAISEGGKAFDDVLLKKLSTVIALVFDPVINRDEVMASTPVSAALELAIPRLNLEPEQVLVVSGKSSLIQQAQDLGFLTVFFDPTKTPEISNGKNAYHISRLEQAVQIVRLLTPLPAGKLPNDLLREFLDQFNFEDPSVIINPGVGEDTAAVDVESEEILVLKSDPITFATDAIGQYAVLINANDIATSGAQPRWLLTTLLFPCGVTPSEIHQVIKELKEFCRNWEITLCGGHTEVTDAVTRPVVTGMMAGTVAGNRLIDKRNMASGDRVLLTKGVSVEGTAIIAREFGDRLAELGLAEAEIERCRQFLNNISIITEAQIAAKYETTSAMHDVTEGGLATALEEMSIAGGHRIKIDMDAIQVFDETRKICTLLGIQPLGLIGSGSLLICCRADGCDSMMKTIRESGIEVSCIGEVLEKGQGISAIKNGRPTDWPQFEVDEITRLF